MKFLENHFPFSKYNLKIIPQKSKMKMFASYYKFHIVTFYNERSKKKKTQEYIF